MYIISIPTPLQKWSQDYYFPTSPMEVSCLMSSYCFCNAQLFINPNPTPKTAFFQKEINPNPDHTFYWHPFEFVHFFMYTHPTLLPISTLFLGILLFDAFENVYYFLLHIMMSAAISICHFSCVCLEKYCHLREGIFYFLFASPPKGGEGWTLTLTLNNPYLTLTLTLKLHDLKKKDRLRLRPRVFLTPNWNSIYTIT